MTTMHATRILVTLSLLGLTGCSLPALPRLPKLPKLPSLPSVTEVLPVGSSGQSLKEAAAQAFAKADAWAPGAAWVSLTGLKLDPGGRNGGHDGGVWIFTFQSEAQARALEVRVTDEAVTEREISKKVYQEAPLDRQLGGVLDSHEAVAKAGLTARSLTIVLRQEAAGAVYNMVEEGGTARAVLDAATGESRQ